MKSIEYVYEPKKLTAGYFKLWKITRGFDMFRVWR